MIDPTDYGSGEPVDIQIDVYGLRTFTVSGGQLGSIVKGAGHWKGGVCTARCLMTEHKPPADECACGIYACHSLRGLFGQYSEFASRIVAVIVAEGDTVVGDMGLRTSAARIVAYWCADGQPAAVLRVCAEQCPDARRFRSLKLMTRMFGLGGFE
jgi:hypothetical protein